MLAADEALDSLPRRIILASARRPLVDEQGFVLPLPADEIVPAADLLHCSAALIVAPPWTGKTFVSEQLHHALRSRPALPPGFGDFHARVCFETLGRDARVKPLWWDDWMHGEGHACWIIDAIDEDERSGDRRIDEILCLLEDLGEARARLHALFFCRESEVPPAFLDRAERLFGTWSPSRPGGLRRLRLAGLDRESARNFVGADAFERIYRIIEIGGLKELASLPIVLRHLKDRQLREPLDRLEIWREVLKDLLRERPGRSRLPLTHTEVEDRFEVVQWLAAVLTFSSERELRVNAPGPGSGLEDLIPRNIPGREFRILREAAREALRTAVFERSGNGFRFAQDHVRQWFAAFALEDMALLRARPLLTDENGKLNPAHAGILDLLAKVAPELRNWIEQAFGGVVPPSDTVPWTLHEAVRALDKLQELASCSPWGLALWHEERLGQIAAPGLGAEIAKRLEGSLPSSEQELLLDVALAVGASEALEPAARIVRDGFQAPRARALAADLLAKLGGVGELKSLEPWVRSPSASDEGADSARSILVASFFRTELWDFETTASFALSRKEPGNDWLQYLLSEEMTLGRARRLVSMASHGEADLLGSPLVQRAIERILEQDEPDGSDWDLLLPFVFWQDELDSAHRDNLPDLIRAFERKPESRRKLFLKGLARDPDRKLDSWRWRVALDGDDAAWLLDVVRGRRGEPAWLQETLYYLSHQKGASRTVQARVRRELEAWGSVSLEQLDQERRGWRRKEPSRTRKQAEAETRVQELGSLIRNTLEEPGLDLRLKMLRLSRCCFVKSSHRPTNISGQWEDLGEDLRAEAMDLCRQALIESEPTPIPEGSNFPVSVLWEAACFGKLLTENPGFVLTSELIRKWLPSVLRCWETDWKLVLQRCIDVDRELFENLVVEAVLHDVLREAGATSYTAQQLTREMWSERLAARLESGIVLVPSFSPQARIELLARIGRVHRDRSATVAQSWADNPAEDPELREAGIDILLSADPVLGWSRLIPLIRQEGAMPVLLRMRSLLPHHWGPEADFETWPAALLEQLVACLIEALPPDSDPERAPGQAYSLDEEDDLRFLRDAIPALLFRRDREGDAEALERLAQAYPSVRLWLDQTQAQRGAEGVLAGLGDERPPSPGSPGQISASQVVRLLQDSRYRLLRTAGDLQAVVLEELERIAADATSHLAMLYRPREKSVKRRRLHEDALQAYLYCRLSDRLSLGILEPHPRIVFLDREPLAARNTRNDLKIQTNSLDNKPLTLIIEVKWSDNGEVSTSLVEQLGKEYLLGNGLTHGIYLVGWCGRGVWKGEPKPASGPESWQARLEEQARLFRQEQQGLSIVPFILDLTWDSWRHAET